MPRLAVFATHPTQVHVPIWRKLTALGLDVTVHFFSDTSVRGSVDPQFGVPVSWDVPVLGGYEHVFLERAGDEHGYHRSFVRFPGRLLREGRFDCVMVGGYTRLFMIQMVLAARRLGLKTLHRGELTHVPPGGTRPKWKSVVREPYLKWFYRRIDAFCVVGETSRRHLVSYGITQDRLFSSPYSVDTEMFERLYQGETREGARSLLGFSDDDVVILYCGKMIDIKAPMLLLDAVQRMRDRANVRLVMLGAGYLYERVARRAEALLGDRKALPGFVNQTKLGSYYRAADVLVLPSLSETWGLVVNEAMQFGVPCIVSSTVGCAPDLVRPGETGEVFEQGDAGSLAAHFDALTADPARWRKMGATARRHVSGYSPEASARGVIAAVEALTRQAKRRS